MSLLDRKLLRDLRALKSQALAMGFGHVESGPLVRSSYHAHEQTESLERRAAAGA